LLTLPGFNRLKVFHYVYNSGSIQKAAAELHVTRSAVSQSIKALEEELGSDLFIRTNKAILPTLQADKLSETISPFIRNLGETLNFFQRGKNEPYGLIKLGAPVQFGTNILVKEIAKFKRKYPNTQFQLELGVPPKLLEKVSKNKLHFAFVDNGDQFEGQYPVLMKGVWKEQFVLVCSRKYYKRKIQDGHHFNQLIKNDFISYIDHGPVIKMWFKHHFKKIPTKFNIGVIVENVHGIINAVQADLGLGVIPQYLINDKLKSGGLVKIDVKTKEFENKLALAQLPDKKPSITEKFFLSEVQKNLKEYI